MKIRQVVAFIVLYHWDVIFLVVCATKHRSSAGRGWRCFLILQS